MSRTARITSVERLADFRAELCEFGTDARDTLSAIDGQIRRTFNWLSDQLKHWQREVKVRQEELVRAKIELEQRKNMSKDGRGPGTAHQEKAFRKAQARLKEAEEKVANCKRWHPLLDHAVREYYAPARQLGGALDTELPNALAWLQQRLEALEAYLSLAPPSTALPATAGSASEEMPPSVATPAAEPPAAVPVPEAAQPEPASEEQRA
jgi:hypothetical protein